MGVSMRRVTEEVIKSFRAGALPLVILIAAEVIANEGIIAGVTEMASRDPGQWRLPILSGSFFITLLVVWCQAAATLVCLTPARSWTNALVSSFVRSGKILPGYY